MNIIISYGYRNRCKYTLNFSKAHLEKNMRKARLKRIHLLKALVIAGPSSIAFCFLFLVKCHCFLNHFIKCHRFLNLSKNVKGACADPDFFPGGGSVQFSVILLCKLKKFEFSR